MSMGWWFAVFTGGDVHEKTVVFFGRGQPTFDGRLNVEFDWNGTVDANGSSVNEEEDWLGASLDARSNDVVNEDFMIYFFVIIVDSFSAQG